LFFGDVIDGWRLSPIGRGLVALAASSGIAAIIVYVFTN